MNSLHSGLSIDEQSQQHHVFRAAVFLLIGIVVALIGSIYLASQFNTNQLFIVVAIIAALGVAVAISALLCRRGFVAFAMRLMLAAFWISLVLIASPLQSL